MRGRRDGQTAHHLAPGEVEFHSFLQKCIGVLKHAQPNAAKRLRESDISKFSGEEEVGNPQSRRLVLAIFTAFRRPRESLSPNKTKKAKRIKLPIYASTSHRDNALAIGGTRDEIVVLRALLLVNDKRVKEGALGVVLRGHHEVEAPATGNLSHSLP